MIQDHSFQRSVHRSIFSKTGLAGFVVVLLSVLSGCTYLPSDGPSGSQIKSAAGKSYDLIPITTEVVGTLKNSRNVQQRNSLSSLASATKEARTRDLRFLFRFSVAGTPHAAPSGIGIERLPETVSQKIAAGDTVNITIFETGSTLFGSVNPATGAKTSSSQLPTQTVDESGEITVPYAGRVSVMGRTTRQVELEIADKLNGKAIDPQVIVTLGERKGGNYVTVSGDVKNPKLFHLGISQARILDALTDAGGSSGRAHETVVSVSRGSVMRSDSLAEIIGTPSKNVPLQTGDTITVKTKLRSFLAFGATGTNRRFPFDADQMSLAEAMAHSGGPLDSRANPGNIFVHRLESVSLVRKLGYHPSSVVGDAARVIYQIDLTSPSGFFLAQSFEVQDKDIIYYASSKSTGLSKFLGLLNSAISSATGPAVVATQL